MSRAQLDSGAYLATLMNMDKGALPPDGGERFNRLIFARSPYLLQHAENPVDWYEWGDAAFAAATGRDVPILLSIGYATCHWCHVMAHESFEDTEVASLLNRHFVCIKVDREERPDIDDFYMTAAQVLTGSSGWPLNVFMAPDRRPFFAMTYLPKRGRSGRSGMMELLPSIATLWRQQPERIRQNCSGIMEALGQLARESSHEGIELGELSSLAFSQLEESYDREYGGFGPATKFPLPITLGWLVDQGGSGNRPGLEMALQTLRAIRQGGVWDQLGGGLHRYSVDREWLVPHFEKMLYDQAMLALTALEAFQVCGDTFLSEMAEEIFGFVRRELTAPEGGFFSALDADSEGEEGKFYLWRKTEIDACLGADSELFCAYFDVSPRGNFEGASILNIPVRLEEFSTMAGLDPEQAELALEQCVARLLERRNLRIRPLRDEKIITAWNGLMIAALARGGAITGQAAYVAAASRAASFVMGNLRRPDGRLLRSALHGAANIPGFLEDYASLCFGLIELFEATLDTSWLDKALLLAEEMIRIFYDPATVQFHKSGHDAEQMPQRATLDHDGVMPSPFSLAAKCLCRLGHACDRPDLHDLAHVLLSGPLADARSQPTAHLGALQALAMLEREPCLITFSGSPDDPGRAALLAAVNRYKRADWVIRRPEESAAAAGVQVCANDRCHPAVDDRDGLGALLRRLTSPAPTAQA